MASITGFGGAFVRANDPEALSRWYERHVGPMRSEGSFAFLASTQRGVRAFKQTDTGSVGMASDTAGLIADINRPSYFKFRPTGDSRWKRQDIPS
jgi:hypothetical protein